MCPIYGESALHRSQPAIELVGKCLPVLGGEIRRASGDLATPSQFVEQIANRKALADVGLRVQLPARIEGLPALSDYFSGQRDVSRDHKIAPLDQFYDTSVGHVHAGGNQHTVHEPGAGRTHGLVGDHGHLGLRPLGGSEQQVLDLAWASVCIDPYLHITAPQS